MGNKISYYLKTQNKPIIFESDEDRPLNEIVNELTSSLKEMGLSKCFEKDKYLIIKNDEVLAVLVEKTKKRKNSKDVVSKNIEKPEKVVKENKDIEELNIPEINLDLPEIKDINNKNDDKLIIEEDNELNNDTINIDIVTDDSI